jgi:hypothetical protein
MYAIRPLLLSAQILSFILRLLRPLGGWPSHSAAFDRRPMKRIGDGGYQRSCGGLGSRRIVIVDFCRCPSPLESDAASGGGLLNRFIGCFATSSMFLTSFRYVYHCGQT